MAGWALASGSQDDRRARVCRADHCREHAGHRRFFGIAPWDPLAIHRGFTHGWSAASYDAADTAAAICGCSTGGRSAVTRLQERTAMQFGWLVARLLFRRDHASVARYADHLFGPAASRPSRTAGSMPTGCSSSIFGSGCVLASPSAFRAGASTGAVAAAGRQGVRRCWSTSGEPVDHPAGRRGRRGQPDVQRVFASPRQ